MKLVLTLLLTIPLFFSCSKKENKSADDNQDEIDVVQVQTASINNFEPVDKGIILDIRTPDEIAKGSLPNAQFLDFLEEDYEEKMMGLDKSKTYYVYCASGGRSGEMTKEMVKAGFKSVVDLNDGYSKYKLPEATITIDN